MGKGKLAKFALLTANPLVVERSFRPEKGAGEGADELALKGRWREDFFHNDLPLTLELGCGRGEYTVGLAETHPGGNFIGVDIKGARMYAGAEDARKRGMKNVGFLRVNIEFIDRCFGEDEVHEVWLTFSDPQMKKATKRLTSTYFLRRYRRFLVDGGRVHVKTDSQFLFTYTLLMLQANNIVPLASTDDLYATSSPEAGGDLTAEARRIQTHYERMWLSEGIPIKYLCFPLRREGELLEPQVEIPFDDYRSYHRTRRGAKEAGK